MGATKRTVEGGMCGQTCGKDKQTVVLYYHSRVCHYCQSCLVNLDPIVQ